jgi:hypothetical protein
MREAWTNISTKTAIQAKELYEAEMLADRILSAVGQREQTPAVAADAAENRQRAFTLFIQAYSHARRAVAFFHWDAEDLDEVAPSVYTTGRAARRKAESNAPPPRMVTPDAGAPAAAKPVANGPSKGIGFPDSDPLAPE